MTDLDLLQRYAQQRSEEAFATLVDRHLNFVYATALRQVRSPQLAEDVAQSVFMSLARNSNTMKPDTVLTAWLYCVTRHAAIDLLRGESRRQAREQAALEIANMKSDSTEWAQVEPLLDEALETLDETDRCAILLRYFENKSLREVGATLGTSEDAAQKRVSRAVEQLRGCFSKRGVAVSATSLIAGLGAQATQAAPAGLSAAITTAAALATPTLSATATATTAKAIVMTTLQKTLVIATIMATAGAGIYEARQASTLRSQIQSLQQQQAPPADQIEQLTRERDEANAKLAALGEDKDRTSSNTAELLKLRGEVGVLRQQTNELEKLRALNHTSRQVPPDENQKTSQILELVSAKDLYVQSWLKAFLAYAHEHQGQCPESFQQAELFLPESVRTQISRTGGQFEILYSGSLDAIKDQDVIVFREKKLWEHIGGKWGRFYGIADGRAQYCSSSDKTATGNFDDYEKQHAQLSRQ